MIDINPEPSQGEASKPPQFGILSRPSAITVLESDSLWKAVEESLEEVIDFDSLPLLPAIEGADPARDHPEELDARSRLVARVIEELGKRLERAEMGPELRTTAEVLEHILPIVKEAHEALEDREVLALAAAFAQINRNQDPLVTSREMIKENARQRAMLLSTWPTLTSKEVNEYAGHRAKNAAATASRWKNRRLIFAVNTADGLVYPEFQFSNGEPHPTIAIALANLSRAMTNWEVAFWFTSPNGYLDGVRPAESLADADEIAEAARFENSEIGG